VIKRIALTCLSFALLGMSTQRYVVAASSSTLSVNAQTFRPALGPENMVMIEGSRTSGQWQPMAALWFDWAHKPLRLLEQTTNTIYANTIPNMVTMHIMAGLGFTKWLSVGFSLPVVMFQEFDRKTPLTDFPQTPSNFGIGDLRLIAKMRILDNSEGGIGLAFVPQITFKTGQGQNFRGDDAFGFEPRFAIDYKFKNGIIVAANLSAFLKTQDQQLTNVKISHQMRYGLGAYFALPKNFGLVADLNGATSLMNLKTVYSPLELYGGLRWRHQKGVQIDVGAGGGLLSAVGSPQVRIYAGIAYYPVKEKSAPTPVPVPASLPASQPVDLDPDKDGVLNPYDMCPDVPGPASNQGCPILDKDRDGVLDPDDACPEVPGPVENKGCPWPDTDKDTTPDHLDKCPYDFGPPPDGCPEKPRQFVEVKKNEIFILQKVHFEVGKSIIKPVSFPLLDEVADVLKNRPTMKVSVDGHTDSTGSAKLNEKLSQKRSEAVRLYLIKRGIESDRLMAKGYGPSKPVADNKTKEGRARNRRTEFVILEQ